MAFIITPPSTIKIDKAQDNITTSKALWSSLNLADDIFKPTKEILSIMVEQQLELIKYIEKEKNE